MKWKAVAGALCPRAHAWTDDCRKSSSWWLCSVAYLRENRVGETARRGEERQSLQGSPLPPLTPTAWLLSVTNSAEPSCHQLGQSAWKVKVLLWFLGRLSLRTKKSPLGTTIQLGLYKKNFVNKPQSQSNKLNQNRKGTDLYNQGLYDGTKASGIAGSRGLSDVVTIYTCVCVCM